MSEGFSNPADDLTFINEYKRMANTGEKTQLRTSASASGEVALSTTTYTLSDILQGAATYKPRGLAESDFNQILSSDLNKVIQLNNGKAANLAGRESFLPSDINNETFSNIPDTTAKGSGTAAAASVAAGSDPSLPKGKYTDFTDTTGVTGQRSEEIFGGSTITVATYKGTTLNTAVIASWKAMVDAAEVDGIVIKGGGFRSYKAQAELYYKYIHGIDNQPLTAKPGTSRHEKGAAVDVSGASSRSSDVSKWLAANAATYGWINLPQEAWHWSIDGH